MMRFAIVAVVAILVSETASSAEPLHWVKKPELTFDAKAKKWYATFELDALTDVEVALIDPVKNTVIRHLAAGVLGPKAPPPEAVAGTFVAADGKKIKVKPLSDEDRLTLIRWVDLGCPIDLTHDQARPEARAAGAPGATGEGFLADRTLPTLTIRYPQAGASREPLTRFLVGMHDHYSGLAPESFQVVADFLVDGMEPGQNLASKFKLKTQGVWELKLTRPISALPRGKLTVSVKDRQGNVTRMERAFSVAKTDGGD